MEYSLVFRLAPALCDQAYGEAAACPGSSLFAEASWPGDMPNSRLTAKNLHDLQLADAHNDRANNFWAMIF